MQMQMQMLLQMLQLLPLLVKHRRAQGHRMVLDLEDVRCDARP